MKIDIAESIREVLCDRQPVNIYGLGTLCLKQIPAQYGDKRKTLLPPTMRLEFKETNTDKGGLMDWLINKYDLKVNDANNAIKKFSESVLNTLLNYGKVYIPGVALFRRNEANELICDADSSLTSTFYRNFPIVDLKLPDTGIAEEERKLEGESKLSSVTKTASQKEVPPESDSIEDDPDPIEAPEDDNGAGTEEETGSLVKMIEEESPDKDMSAEDMIVFDIESEIQKLKDELDNEIEEREQSSFPWRKLLGSLLILISLVLVVIVMIDACKYMGGTNKDELAGPEAMGIEGMEAQDSLSTSLLKGDGMTQEYMPETCIIITGVFSAESNIEKMKLRIQEAGHDIYSEQNGLYTRIGLEFDCREIDLEAFIGQIRRDISPKAWYLNPELYVSYSN